LSTNVLINTMDPTQNQHERRSIRKNYRGLIQKITDSKAEYIRPESDGLIHALEKGDELYQTVKNTREAALDSEFLSIASQVGLERTRRLRTLFKAFEIDEFVVRVRAHLQGGDANNNNVDDSTEYVSQEGNWKAIGQRDTCSAVFQSTPLVDFMYGPLSIEPIQKKARKKTVREKSGQVVRPEEILDTQMDNEAETTHRVAAVKSHLDSAKSVDFFRFVLDPESFGQTVENIFHTAFLVKDGHAQIRVDNNAPILEPAQPPVEADYNSGKAQKKQCIVRFDWSTWEKLKAKSIGPTVLPHRQPGEYRHPGLPPNGTAGRPNRKDDENEESGDESEGEKRKKRPKTRKTPQTKPPPAPSRKGKEKVPEANRSPDIDDETFVADSQGNESFVADSQGNVSSDEDPPLNPASYRRRNR